MDLTPVPLALDLDGYLAFLLLAAGMFLGGLLTIHRGFQLRKQRELIEDTPTEDVESISMGPSEVTGEVVPREGAAEGFTLDGSDASGGRSSGSEGSSADDGPEGNPLVDDSGACLRSPFGNERCVVATWEVEEWDEAGDDERWRTVHEEFDGVPFYLDDGTGQLLVEPSEAATLELEGDEFEEPLLEVASGEDPPARVSELLDRHPDLGPSADPAFETLDTGNQHGDRRYYEAILRPGEEGYVFGTVQPREGTRSAVNPENAIVRSVDGEAHEEPLFMISNKPEADLVDDREWALWRVPAGALLAAAGFAGLVWLLANPPL